MLDLDAKLLACLFAQHGVIHIDDVIALGGTWELVRGRLASGQWARVHRGVYRLVGVPWTYEAKVYAAVRAAGKGAVASHFCAARLSSLGFPTAAIEITVPRGAFHRPQGITVHTSTDLDRCATVMRDGIATTEPTRVALDVARKLGATSLASLIETGRRLEVFTWRDLAACLAAHARPGRPGVRKLREAVATGSVNDGVTDTTAELVALTLLRERGFPEPVLQHKIWDGGRLVASMDLAYPHRRVDFEIDGSVHDRPEVRAKDESRDFELRERYDWIVRRIPEHIPLSDPRRFVEIVRTTLAAAQARQPSRPV